MPGADRTGVDESLRARAEGSQGISCFLAPGEAPGLTAAAPERKMGLTGSTKSPDLFQIARTLGRDEVIRRITSLTA